MNHKQDQNGVLYLFEPVQGKEFYQTDEVDLHNDGTRWEFNKVGQPGMEILGYFKWDQEEDDTVSGKLYGGKHPSDGYPSKCYVSQLDFKGNDVMLMIEHFHPDWVEGPNGNNMEKKTGLNLGALKGRWFGIRYLCFNTDNNTKVRIVTLVDNHYSGEGEPENNWKVIADWTDHGQYTGDGSDERPYTTPHEDPESSIRIDEVLEPRPTAKFVTMRNIDASKPLTNIVT